MNFSSTQQSSRVGKAVPTLVTKSMVHNCFDARVGSVAAHRTWLTT